MKNVDQYKKQIPYRGTYEDFLHNALNMDFADLIYTREDTDCFDKTISVDDDIAEDYVGKYTIENLYPCNKIALVTWWEEPYIEE